jgi:hypothetical protein
LRKSAKSAQKAQKVHFPGGRLLLEPRSRPLSKKTVSRKELPTEGAGKRLRV